MCERRDGPERHDAKVDPAWTGGRLSWVEASRTTASTRFAGVVGDGMSTRSDKQHGKSRVVKRPELQPTLREESSRAGRDVGGAHGTVEAGESRSRDGALVSGCCSKRQKRGHSALSELERTYVYFSGSLRGRPMGRSEDSRLRRAAVAEVQRSPPQGVPRRTL